MKRIVALAACLMLMCASACAQVLPDAGASLDVNGRKQMTDYVFSQDYVCDVWVYPRDNRTEELLAGWIMQVLDSGYTVSADTVEGETAYRLEDENGLYALLLPRYQGAVMLMLQQGMTYAPAVVTPSPTIQPTVRPTDIPAVTGSTDDDGGEWMWVTVEKDCPSCTRGVCSTCNGTGVYRLYGEAVWCRTYCSSCDGVGTYTTREYQYVKHN